MADVGEPDSLAAMCKQAVIVLNCVGPVSTDCGDATHTHILNTVDAHTHCDSTAETQ